MALISDPKILFLDEPTLGLDVIARSELWALIRSLKGKTTILLTTHNMEEAEALSDRIAIMKDGELLLCDRAEEIKRSVGELLLCDRAEEIKRSVGTDRLEEAFVRIVKGERS